MKFSVVLFALSILCSSPLICQTAAFLNPAPLASVPSTPADIAPSSFPLTVQSRVQEVNLVLSVTDKKGRFVAGLQPSDLKIVDNNTQQHAITFFQGETNLPLRVALLMDVSTSVKYRFSEEQWALNAFLKATTRPSDAVTAFAFNQDIQLVSPVTDNWKQISRRIKKLKPDGDTALFDAVSSASRWLAEDPRPARRIVILVTDGEENSSKGTLDSAISDALRAEAAIYSVNVGDEGSDSYSRAGANTLRRLSDATGGSYLRAAPGHDVRSAFTKIKHELRSQYLLGYRPSNLADALFHQVHVVASSDLRVRCRFGYFVK
jgi:Ca-activated chloride channel family protein